MRYFSIIFLLLGCFFISAEDLEIKITKKEKLYSFGFTSNDIEIEKSIIDNFKLIHKIDYNNNSENQFKIKKENKNHIVEYKNKSYSFNNKNTANKISDYIYQSLTNNKSFFLENIVFIKKNNQKYTLIKSDFSGKNQKEILISREPIISPDISSNGKFVTYVSFEKIIPIVFLHYLENNKRIEIANFKGVNAYPKISNDNLNILLSISKNGNADIYSYDILLNTLTALTKEKSNELSPEWIDSENLLITSDMAGNPNIYYLKNNRLNKTFKSKNYTISPSFSKDYIIALYQKNGFFGLIGKDNENKEEFDITKDFYIESPSISKNGNLIVYSTKENNKSIINFVNIDGDRLFSLKYKNYEIIEPSF
jgi:TolB protein